MQFVQLTQASLARLDDYLLELSFLGLSAPLRFADLPRIELTRQISVINVLKKSSQRSGDVFINN